MNLGVLAARNVLRNKQRTILTVLGVAVAVVAFILLRTILWAWTVAIDEAATDRLASRHKVSFILPLPLRYAADARQVPGVKAVTWMNYFGGRDPKRPREFFGSMAIDAKSAFEVYPELALPPEQKEAWLANREGAIIGDVLARKMGWKVGDTVTLEGSIYPGNWRFRIDGVYGVTRKTLDRSSFFFHWEYLNESLPQVRKDQIGYMGLLIDDPRRSADIAKAVDQMFDDRDVQTVTMSEKAMGLSMMGMLSAVLKALNAVSIVILVIMALVLGNTVAMGVRERTTEYGVLRAIGFLPRHVATFVLGEALTVGVLGGGVGLALAYPLIGRGLGPWLEDNVGVIFPFFRITPGVAGTAFALALVLGLVASVIPAYRASRLDVVDALRRVG